ncbi:MAG: DUF4830 domain-containing protein [Ruminococcus sp.]|nr:DUF4830 domain-containing protein [Ruminococcus sp.]
MNRKITAAVALTAVVCASFAIILHFRHEETAKEPLIIPAAEEYQRTAYFASHGWEVREIARADILIPAVFSEEYAEYVRIQDRQRLPLRENAGKNAVIYTYDVRNFSPDSMRMYAELIVCDGNAAASLVYSEDGESIIMPVS